MTSRHVSRFLGPTGGWKRRVLALTGGLLITAGLAFAESSKPDISSLTVRPISISAQPILHFDREDKDRTRYGRLDWLGGAVLTANSKNFGGWSGLELDADGRKFVAVSDAGAWLTGELRYNGGRLSGVDHAQIGPLKALSGKLLSRRRDRDAEAVVLLKGTFESGTLLLGFEQNDRIGIFPISQEVIDKPSRYLDMPTETSTMRIDGLETVAVLRGGKYKGAIVALAERANRRGENTGWIWQGRKSKRFSLSGAAGFDITDAKGLADGSLLLLERRFRWNEGVRMRLSLIPAEEIRAGAKLTREILVQLDMDQQIDNMEGMALHTNARGETIVTLISDDNFNKILQRTVLLQFVLRRDSTADGAASRKAAQLP